MFILRQLGRYGLAAALTVMFALTLSVRADEAQMKSALALAPDTAPIVVVVPSAKQFQEKINAFLKKLGVPDSPDTDLFKQFQQETGIGEALSNDGPIVFAILNTDFMKQKPAGGAEDEVNAGGDEPEFVAILPLKDEAALIKSLNATKGADGVISGSTVDGEPLFVRTAGKSAILSNKAKSVQRYKAGTPDRWSKSLSAGARAMAAGSDVVGFFDMTAMQAVLAPKLKEFTDMMTQQMEAAQGMGGPMGGSEAVGKAMVNLMYRDLAQAIVRDATVAVLGGDLTDKGVALSAAAMFKEGSKCAKVLGTVGDSTPMLAKLKDANYLFAGVINLKGMDVAKIKADVLAAFPKDDKSAMVEMIRTSMASIDSIQGIAQGYYPPAQPGMGPIFSGITVATSTDPKTYLANTRKSMESLAKLGDAGKPADPNQPAPPQLYSVQYTPDAFKIGDVSVDQYNLQMNLPQEAMAANPAIPMMMNMMGLANQAGQLAIKGNDLVAVVNGDQALMKQAIEQVSAGKGLGQNPLIEQVRKDGLPDKPAIQYYISPAGLVGVANNFMVMFGMNAIQAPNNLPPIAMGASINNGNVTSRMYVPMSVITFVSDTIKQLQQQQMQGQDPGQGGGGQGGPPPAPMN